MPPAAIPPIVALATLGAAVIARWVMKEARRINEQLDSLKTAKPEPIDRSQIPTLRRDPRTGEYRLG